MEFNIGDMVQYNGHLIGYIIGVRQEDNTKTKVYVIEMFDGDLMPFNPVYAIPKYMKKV
jgi:RNA polymerase-interacting CarD/CdnL/TRCF family regulator